MPSLALFLFRPLLTRSLALQQNFLLRNSYLGDWIRKILDSRLRKNMRIHGFGSKGVKYQPKNAKKKLF